MDPLLRKTAAELKKARSDVEATKAALLRYYQQGIKAKVPLEQLNSHLYDLLQKVGYTADQMVKALSAVNGLHSINFGLGVPATGVESESSAADAPRAGGDTELNADIDACIEIAKQFGHFLASSDFTAAHALLTTEARKIHPASKLKKALNEMTAYAPGPLREVEVMEDVILDDWPDRQSKDLAWIYVSLAGDSYAEAVSLVLVEEAGSIRIRHLEWGRP